MSNVDKITIITPCFNAEKYIEETIVSVLNQKAVLNNRVKLDYYICDGGSNDNTLNIIEKYASKGISIFSEPDSGMYDALTKGLKKIKNGWCAYLNAGDYYSTYAFDIVLDLIEAKKDIDWVSGLTVYYNDNGYPLNFALPFRYRNKLLQKGLYGIQLPFIQQESTFWNAELNKYLDYSFLPTLHLAGDYYLWYVFSKYAKLNIIEAFLGGFRIHPGQKSEDLDSYFNEIMSFCSKPNVIDRVQAMFDNIIWRCPISIKKRLNKKGLFRFDHENQMWY